MGLADGMILAAALLPYITVAPAKWTGHIDNHAPRRDMERLEGWRRRADWAHRNHFEAFAPFAAAVLVAELARAPQGRVDGLAVVFILLRLAYTGAYLADAATVRSIIWSLGFIVVIRLFLFAV